MRTEIIQVPLPKEIIKSAKKIGMTKQDIREIMKTFAILEIAANLSQLRKGEAEKISKKIKASAWRKTKKKLGV